MLRGQALVAALGVLFMLACRRTIAQPRAPRPAPQITQAAPPPPAPPAPPTPRWTEAFHLRHKAFPHTGFPDVVVHAPEGFDARQPLHLVIFGHSFGSYAMQWLASGMAPVVPGRGNWVGWGLDTRHDLTRTNTLLIAPQFDAHRGSNWNGPFSRDGWWRQWLQELIEEALTSRIGPHSIDDIASITLVGSSIGGYVVEGFLQHSGLADRVRNVVLLDAFYDGEPTYAAWLARGTPTAPRRFVSVHGGLAVTRRHAANMITLVRARGITDIRTDPPGSIADAIRAHRVVTLVSGAEHIGMALLYYPKVLAALGLPTLPERPGLHALKDLRDPSRVEERTIRVGERLSAELTQRDARNHDDSACHVWRVDLTEAVPVRITAASEGRDRNVWLRARLDTLVRVFDGEREVAADDDSGGGLGAMLNFTPPRAGSYTIRVTTAAPWFWGGRYTLAVEPVR